MSGGCVQLEGRGSSGRGALLPMCMDENVDSQALDAWEHHPAALQARDGRAVRGRQRSLRQVPRLWASLFNAVRTRLLHQALKRFVDAVSVQPDVREVVLFDDAEGLHVWTLMTRVDYDTDTLVTKAECALIEGWPEPDLDCFSLACAPEEFQSRLPSGFVRVYMRS